ncbi:anti-sigma factor family protein [candidate division KSB1 bacterium]
MDCKDIVLLFPEFVNGQLDDPERETVQSHLEECENCRIEYTETEKFLGVIETDSEEKMAPPEGYFAGVWQNLYIRIQEEGLNKKTNGIGGVLKTLSIVLRQRTYQAATVAVAAVLFVSLYFSMQSDRYRPSDSLLFQALKSAGIESTFNELPVNLENGQKKLTGVLSLGIGTTDEPLKQWEEILSSEKRQDFYDSLTDYLADAVIKLSKNEFRDG